MEYMYGVAHGRSMNVYMEKESEGAHHYLHHHLTPASILLLLACRLNETVACKSAVQNIIFTILLPWRYRPLPMRWLYMTNASAHPPDDTRPASTDQSQMDQSHGHHSPPRGTQRARYDLYITNIMLLLA